MEVKWHTFLIRYLRKKLIIAFRLRLLYFKGWTPSTNPWRMGHSAVRDVVRKGNIRTFSEPSSRLHVRNWLTRLGYAYSFSLHKEKFLVKNERQAYGIAIKWSQLTHVCCANSGLCSVMDGKYRRLEIGFHSKYQQATPLFTCSYVLLFHGQIRMQLTLWRRNFL